MSATEQELKLIKDNAKKAYKEGNADQKKLLQNLFPTVFSEKITDRVKSFEDACTELAIDPNHLPDVSMLPPEDQEAIVAHYKLTVIAKALNEGWQPDWSNHSEYKYYPWLDVKADKNNPSGLGLSYCDYAGWNASTDVGSRLSFKTIELAEYAGRTFIDLYRVYMLFNQ